MFVFRGPVIGVALVICPVFLFLFFMIALVLGIVFVLVPVSFSCSRPVLVFLSFIAHVLCSLLLLLFV